MPSKNHKENLWNQTIASRTIINALKQLEKENPSNKERYFSFSQIKSKALDIGIDKNGDRIEWSIIKSTFINTLKRMHTQGDLEHIKMKAQGKRMAYSFYRLNLYKNRERELKDSYKEEELNLLRNSLNFFPLYSFNSILTSGINIKNSENGKILEKLTELHIKLRNSWIKSEIERYLTIVQEHIATSKKLDDENKKGQFAGYSLDHLDWWLKFIGEDPTKYKQIINKLLRVNGTIKNIAFEYIRRIKNIYKHKRKGIEEISKRMWKDQPYVNSLDKKSGIGEYLSKFLEKLREVKKEGYFSADEAKLLRIHFQMGIRLSKSDVCTLPTLTPTIVIKI